MTASKEIRIKKKKKKKPVFLVCFQNTQACAPRMINFVRF